MKSAGVPGSRRLLWLICAEHVVSHLWILTLPPLFPALAARFGVGFVQLGLLLSVYNLTHALFQVPSGYLVDRYGARNVLVGGMLLHGGAYMLYAVAPSYAVLLFLASLAGAGQSVFHPCNYSMMSAVFPKERAGRPYSLHTFSGYAGTAIAPLTIILLYRLLGWEGAVAASGLLGVLLSLYLAFRLDVPFRAAGGAAATGGRVPGVNGRMILLAQPLVLMFFFYTFISMTSSGLQAFAPATLNSIYAISLGTANVALTVYLACLTVGVLLGGGIADRTSRHARVVGVAFTAGMLLMFLLALVRLPVGLLFFVLAVAGTLHGVIMPSRDKMVREASPPGAEGKTFGFVSTGMAVGGMIAPPVMGYLVDLGRPAVVFWAVGVFMLLAVLTTLPPRRVRIAAPASA